MTRMRKLRNLGTEGDITTLEIEWSEWAPVAWHTAQVQVSGFGTEGAALVPQVFDPPLPVDVLARLASVIEAATALGA